MTLGLGLFSAFLLHVSDSLYSQALAFSRGIAFNNREMLYHTGSGNLMETTPLHSVLNHLMRVINIKEDY